MRLCCGIWNTVTRFFHWKGQKYQSCVPLSFLFRDPTTKKLLGMIGIHVDDDLIPGLETIFRESGGTASEDALLRVSGTLRLKVSFTVVGLYRDKQMDR